MDQGPKYKDSQEKLYIVVKASGLSEQELRIFLEEEGVQLTQFLEWKQELLSDLKKESRASHPPSTQAYHPITGTALPIKPHQKANWLLNIGCALLFFWALFMIVVPTLLKPPRRPRAWDERAGNLKAIGNGAQIWYGEQKNDPDGNPMRRHFPSAASPTGITSGSYTAPAQKPCASGNAQYKKNGKIWDKQPWRALKFGVNKAQYAQYVYIANNSNTKGNPSFTVMTFSDLDCDGTLSTYRVIGTKTPNGDIIRSPLVIRNRGE